MFPTACIVAACASRIVSGDPPDHTPIRTNLVLELIADTTVSEGGTDGSGVASATDTSGQGNNATQATSSKRPALKTGILNGHAVYRFDGVDDYWSVALALAQPCSVFLVAKQADDASVHYFVDAGDASNRVAVIKYANDNIVAFAGVELQQANIWGASQVISVKFSGASSATFANGVAVASGDAGSQGAASLTIGARYSNDFCLSGDFAEILVYSSALSDADRQAVETYLGRKYSISITH